MKINQEQIKTFERNQEYKKIEDNNNVKKTQEKKVENKTPETKISQSTNVETKSNVNTAKVDEIRQQILNGQYKVDAKKIADKLLEDKNLTKTLLP